MTAVDDTLTPIDPRAYPLLAEAGFGADLFNPTQHRACELVEAYAVHQAIAVARALELGAMLTAPRSAGELLADAGFVPSFARGLAWLLARLTDADLLVRSADADLVAAGEHRYSLRSTLPEPELAAIRDAGLRTDGAYEPAYDLLDATAAAYPRVARGETTGERALLARAGLWARYFTNTNPYYAINNRVAARAAVARLTADAAVLELGAGLGSATEALLDELALPGTIASLRSYRATEPVAVFGRRAQRLLDASHPGAPLEFSDLDLNAPWAEQAVRPASVDLLWGVNVFHLARDLDAVLHDAHTSLAPGGWLIVGEGLRPQADAVVGAEFPFQLLASFADVRLDPETRPTPGFLTAEHWLAAFARAGFADVEVVPDVIALRAYYPGFLAGAICGRRP